MTEIWDDLGDTSGFMLPGDEERYGNPEAGADAAAPVEAAAEVTAPTEDATGRLHGEDGKFVAKTDPEPEVEAEATEVEPAVIPEKFEGKSAAELAAAYAELEKHTGALRSELGDRRKSEEELAARLAAIEQHVATPPQAQTPITESFIEQNPGAATQLAYEQGNTTALSAAFEYWKDDDPVGAATWLADAKATAREAELTRRYDEKIASLESRFAPQEAAAADAQYKQALATVAHDHSDLSQFIPAMSAIAEANPTIRRMIEEGSPSEAAETFRTLYKLAKYEQGGAVAETAQSVARQTAEAAQQAREESFVASASTTAGGEKPSPADIIGEQWDNLDRPYTDGWLV